MVPTQLNNRWYSGNLQALQSGVSPVRLCCPCWAYTLSCPCTQKKTTPATWGRPKTGVLFFSLNFVFRDPASFRHVPLRILLVLPSVSHPDHKLSVSENGKRKQDSLDSPGGVWHDGIAGKDNRQNVWRTGQRGRLQ